LRWSRRGQETGALSLTVHEHGLHLLYGTKNDRGELIRISELIPFTYSDAGFGGRRQWLRCLRCGRSCRVIYGGRYFRCRLCHGLRYQSQREPDYDRAIEQATRIGVRLGDRKFNAFEADELPQKPKRMRWRTYRNLEARFAALQRRWKAGACARFGLRF
jgi:DNA-directed RNA polymerase subunit RPC12/RpoP